MKRPGVVINSLLKKTGYRLVSVGPSREQLLAEVETPGAAREFFPAGEKVTLWPIPDELAASPIAWHKVLCSIYSRPASWPASISPEAGMFLHALVRNIQPSRIVETGTCLGVSSIWMAAALKQPTAVVHTFDDFTTPTIPRLANAPLFQNRLETVRERFALAGLAERVTIHVGDSSTEVRRLAAQLRQDNQGVQLAFLDGDHSPKGVTADFLAVEPLLPIGGYVVLHDTFPALCGHAGPRYLLDHLHETTAGKYQVLDVYTAPSNYGLAIMRKI